MDNRSVSYLTFQLGKKEYALPVDRISTILDSSREKNIDTDICYLKGIVIDESGIIPIVSMAELLNVPTTTDEEVSSIIMTNFYCSDKLFKIGLNVDMVTSVLGIGSDFIDEQEEKYSYFLPKAVKAEVKDKCQKIYLLDPKALFSEDDLLDIFIEIKRFLGMQVG